MNAPFKHNGGMYEPSKIVGTYTDKFGNERIVHSPKGRALRVLKEMNTPALRMNRVACELSGSLIREKRISAGLTLDELATRAGLKSQTPKEYMWSIENCSRQHGVRVGTLYAIARVLCCEVGDLLPKVSDVETAASINDVTIVRAE